MSIKMFSRGLIALLAILVMTGCTDKKKMKDMEARMAQLQAEYQQLMEESTTQNEFVKQYSETINEVYDNLERIRKREGFLTRVTRDVEEQEKPLREKMLANIESIDSYLKSSKEKLASLQQQLKNSNVQNETFKNTIEALNQTIAERESHVAQLREEVASLNIKFTEAEWQLKEKETVIQEQQSRLNTVFYIVAPEKELKEKGIIEEKGGILGLRKTKRLAAGFDESEFIPADIVDLNNLEITRSINKVKVLSPHDPNSYHLLKKDDNSTVLEIIDPQEFWKIRYLVIAAES